MNFVMNYNLLDDMRHDM